MEAATTPPAEVETPTDEAILAALVVILLSGMPLPQMTNYANAVLAPLGFPAQAVAEALALIAPHVERPEIEAPATALAHTFSTRPARQAAYLRNAVERIAQDTIRIVHPAQPERMRATEKERRYLAQHLAAERAREEAAKRVDAMAAEFSSSVLTWRATMDSRTTRGCREAHGKAFHVTRPPIVEGQPSWPGTLHGGACRCRPGPPSAAAELLPS